VDIRDRIGASIDANAARRTSAWLLSGAVAKRNTGRRGSSRKRRAARVGTGSEEPLAVQAKPHPARSKRAERPTPAPYKDPMSVGERPQAPWHPLPLSELLILVGAIGTIVGLKRLGHGGISNGGPPLFAGLGAVVLGTLEVTLREHLSGYRSHTLILSLLPVIVFHSAFVLILAAFTVVPRWLNVPLLVLDALLVTVLFKLLRARFLDARRERTFAGRR
jgi:hypothetical protein